MRTRPRAAALAISLVVVAGGTGGGTASQAAAATTDNRDVSLEDGANKASDSKSAPTGASNEMAGVPEPQAVDTSDAG
jgi:hypothetical protein